MQINAIWLQWLADGEPWADRWNSGWEFYLLDDTETPALIKIEAVMQVKDDERGFRRFKVKNGSWLAFKCDGWETVIAVKVDEHGT